jgi:hypothetical protein
MRDLRVLSPRLPLRTRTRLQAERHVDGLCGWLAGHGYCWAAECVWRLCGMW